MLFVIFPSSSSFRSLVFFLACTKFKQKNDSNKHVLSPDDNRKTSCGESKQKHKNKKENKGPDVFESIANPCPELGLPYWDYDLDTVIHDHLEGTKYTVRNRVEGYVDENGHPTGKKRKMNNDVSSNFCENRFVCFLVSLCLQASVCQALK